MKDEYIPVIPESSCAGDKINQKHSAQSPNVIGPLRFSEDQRDRPILGFVSQSFSDKWATILRRDPCSYCGYRCATMTVDHVHAYSKRTKRRMSRTQGLATNGASACSHCNESKRNASLLDYLFKNLVGTRPAGSVRVDWIVGRSVPAAVFRKVGMGAPSRLWWSTLLAETCTLEPSRIITKGEQEFGIWYLHIDGAGVLEIKATTTISAVIESIAIYRLRWVSSDSSTRVLPIIPAPKS